MNKQKISKVSLVPIPTGIDDSFEFSFYDKEQDKNIGKIHYDLNKRNKKAYISFTYIIPEERHKGILKSLSDEIFCNMQCSGMKKIRLHTITEDATKVWTKFGFKITGVEEFIGGNTHTYMEKELSGKCNCNKNKK